jgi:hypothetical protein
MPGIAPRGTGRLRGGAPPSSSSRPTPTVSGAGAARGSPPSPRLEACRSGRPRRAEPRSVVRFLPWPRACREGGVTVVLDPGRCSRCVRLPASRVRLVDGEAGAAGRGVPADGVWAGCGGAAGRPFALLSEESRDAPAPMIDVSGPRPLRLRRGVREVVDVRIRRHVARAPLRDGSETRVARRVRRSRGTSGRQRKRMSSRRAHCVAVGGMCQGPGGMSTGPAPGYWEFTPRRHLGGPWDPPRGLRAVVV